MIKEWHEDCNGSGELDTQVGKVHCNRCNGKGYTELKPDIKVDWDDTIHFTNDKENICEVYIKESK